MGGEATCGARRHAPSRVAALLLAVGLAVAACVPDSAHQVVFRFEDPPPTGGAYTTARNLGRANVTVAVVTRGTGRATATTGTGGTGRALRLPSHSPASGGPAAVLRVRNAGTTDQLDPDRARFELAADVWLDPTSDTPGSADDGDNIVQRGLYDDVTQYKLQIDARYPMCRVKGRSGAVEVWSSRTVATQRWHRLVCVRDGNRVTLSVTSWAADGTPSTVTTSATGATGDLTPASPSVPLSVGGKLDAAGRIVTSADQLNGAVDDVRLLVG